MDKFDTIQGKLFYTVYCMHKSNEITHYQRGRIKDMIVQWDPQIQELIKDQNRLKQNLLEIACSYSENGDSKQTKITPRSFSRLNIRIGQSNFKLASKSYSSLSSPLDQRKQLLI
ncbi:unnamed protein product (macronuclear) [Paramecium tetraurelia]|uniref:Uncharacterized protein n=1 Tax=Paramecium tetraurelia TaxID=5888 RepID=A0EDN6_PARTE|nr:uncharacterized protein GSPATT00025747001 [Paramecium tetraurelia]CAK93403.1 unnamed protein product [Paramecium tetraurelia]|eukprot:XP_001460800.1 hypothetical protein (macronuclear) [Paramecium tetraurelia strain d4-2]